ncbi:hypothetical protein BZA70DRAFT_286155 [Myxozyma melibiosi]|uniref:Uncharacterized protein n=1 Tax=Myxozyma melibiosi TaxID=54550 RepID=A0ABR1F031_9ASCO
MDMSRDDSQLLASFKEAALSVTKLYRAASSDITQAKERGYREAIDDVLSVIASGQDIYEWALAKKYAFSGDEDLSNADKSPAGPHDGQQESKPLQSISEAPNQPQHQQSHGSRPAGMDVTMANGEFTFRSDLQLDRSYQLPSTSAVQQEARDYMMIAPEDVLFHAVSAQLEEEQLIAQQNQHQHQHQHQHEHHQDQIQGTQQSMDTLDHQQQPPQSQGLFGGVKRRNGEFDDTTDKSSGFKRYRF